MEKLKLTIREKEVGSYLAAGLTAKQIAKKLNISFHTVTGYQRTIKQKLQGKTAYQAGYLLREFLDSDSIQMVQEKVKATELGNPYNPS